MGPEYSAKDFRGQASSLCRAAGIDGRDFLNATAPLIEKLEGRPLRVIGGLFQQLILRFEGALEGAAGLEATWRCMQALPFNVEAHEVERRRNFCVPLELRNGESDIDFARAGVQQLARFFFCRALALVHEGPPAPYNRIELETLLRFYVSAASFAGDRGGVEALRAIEFDIGVVEARMALWVLLNDHGILNDRIRLRWQSWPVNRPAEWAFPAAHCKGNFLYSLEVDFPRGDCLQLTDEKVQLSDVLSRANCLVAQAVEDGLRDVYGCPPQNRALSQIQREPTLWCGSTAIEKRAVS